MSGKLVGTLEDHVLVLSRYKDYRKDLQGKLNEMKSWKGFPEKPPYPLSLVDSLRDALESKQRVVKSLDVITVSIEEEFGEYSRNLKNSSKQVRLAEEELEKNAGKPGELRSSWLLQLARLQHEVNQSGVLYGESRRISTRERLKGAQADVDFISQQLAVAKANYRFSAEELKQKQQSIDEQLEQNAPETGAGQSHREGCPEKARRGGCGSHQGAVRSCCRRAAGGAAETAPVRAEAPAGRL